jgi:acyl-CoA thioester hydrolase
MQQQNRISGNAIELIRSEIEPRWSDMDALGHINSLEYLAYMQECRVQWLIKMNLSFDEVTPVLVNLHGEFKAEVVYPNRVEVVMYGLEPGRSSFLTEYEVWAKGDPHYLCATGYAKLVWIDSKHRRPVALPDLIRTQLQ